MPIALDRNDPARYFFSAAIALMLLLHVRPFSFPHDEGDELVYRALGQEMRWDLTHYTTKDHPTLQPDTYSIYAQDLFHHPPLFPLILKAGDTIGQGIAVGLIAQLLAMGLLFAFARKFVRFFELDRGDECAPVLYGLIATCPLLLFSTTRLHHDGLMAILVLCGLIAYVEALETRSARKSVGAGLLLVAGLNTRYNALALIPLVPLAQVLALWRLGRPEGRLLPSDWKTFHHWRVFAIVAALVTSFGLQHYYRILLEYGTLLPTAFIHPLNSNPFLAFVLERTRAQVLGILLMIFPMWLLILFPSTWSALRTEWSTRSWSLFFVITWLLWSGATFLTYFQQLRYFAGAALFGHFALVLLVGVQRGPQRTRARCWIGTSLFLMLGTSLLASTTPAREIVVPVVIPLLPFLAPFYR